jgi:hypothetical protein
MVKIKNHLLAIFYFPLVIITFSLLFFSFTSFFSSVKEVETIITDGNFTKGQPWAFFHNQKIEAPREETIAQGYQKGPAVLSAESGEKWIDVNLTTQTLTAYEANGNIFMSVPVSSGLWAATPTGTFRIWIKLRYTLMHGGSKALGTYYYLPNVPCTQYFYNGVGLHGTYWHNNFGHPMSHGCVNMRTSDACQLFEWTSPPTGGKNEIRPTPENPGTKVVVHY